MIWLCWSKFDHKGIIWLCPSPHTCIKDCLPHLFHGFRNKYLNKVSLAICYTFIIICTSYEKMHGVSINMQWKIIFRIICKLIISSWPVWISVLTACVMLSYIHVDKFLIRARDCDVWINYICPMRQFWPRSAIFKIYLIFRRKVSFNKKYSLNYLSNV